MKHDPIPLTTLTVGDVARLHSADLRCQDRDMLFALGLAESSRFRLCKSGNPWIVQVGGTRVGLSAAIADRLLVIRDGEKSGPAAERRP